MLPNLTTLHLVVGKLIGICQTWSMPWRWSCSSIVDLTWPSTYGRLLQISGERRRDHGSRAHGECDNKIVAVAQPAIHHEAMSVPMREAAE
jgi:hypothetical protein